MRETDVALSFNFIYVGVKHFERKIVPHNKGLRREHDDKEDDEEGRKEICWTLSKLICVGGFMMLFFCHANWHTNVFFFPSFFCEFREMAHAQVTVMVGSFFFTFFRCKLLLRVNWFGARVCKTTMHVSCIFVYIFFSIGLDALFNCMYRVSEWVSVAWSGGGGVGQYHHLSDITWQRQMMRKYLDTLDLDVWARVTRNHNDRKMLA